MQPQCIAVLYRRQMTTATISAIVIVEILTKQQKENISVVISVRTSVRIAVIVGQVLNVGKMKHRPVNDATKIIIQSVKIN